MKSLEYFKELLKEKILIIDGAMGTMIQKYKLSEEDYRGERFKDYHKDIKGNNDLLVLTQPQIIEEIHSKFLEAGADIIETNTFNANSISLLDYQMQDLTTEINIEATKIAKKAADYWTKKTPEKPRFVAGAIGPTNQTLSLSPDVNNPAFRRVSFDTMKAAYNEQATALIDAGVDLILIETIFDTLNAKAAIYAVGEIIEERNLDIPVMISGTIVDKSGRTLSGQTVEAFYISISHTPNLLSVGLNCALGSAEMKTHISDLSKITDKFKSLYPNAGLPNEFGEYDETPEYMANIIGEYIQQGYVNIVGGCCGTTPEHINAIYNKVKLLEK